MIEIKDNCYEGKAFLRDEVADLAPLSRKTIKELCNEYDNLLVFPYTVGDTKDKIGEEQIFSIEGCFEDTAKAVMKTGNIMGFLGRGNTNLRISSRFDNTGREYFMQYMLSRVFSINLFDLKYSSTDEDVLNFLMLLFPLFLRKALSQGVYREYRRLEHNDTHLRGTVDVARFLRQDVLFTGNIAYNTREFCHDNSITELVRHTIEYMMTIPTGEDILTMNEENIADVATIRTVTPEYERLERQRVMQQNLKPKIHPYFTEYYPLQRLCMQILHEEELAYGTNDGDVHGILFDGAWLWEEYLETVLKQLGFNHPHNKDNAGGFWLYEDNTGRRMPDFWRDDYVLDAKYKTSVEHAPRVAKLDVNDQNQMIVYITHLKAKGGAFISPLTQKEIDELPEAWLKTGHKHIAIYGMRIPSDVKDYGDFAQQMKTQEDKLVEKITKELNS